MEAAALRRCATRLSAGSMGLARSLLMPNPADNRERVQSEIGEVVEGVDRLEGFRWSFPVAARGLPGRRSTTGLAAQGGGSGRAVSAAARKFRRPVFRVPGETGKNGDFSKVSAGSV